MRRNLLALLLCFAAGPAIAQRAPTSCAGTITAGATAQVAVAADPRRNYLLIENPTDATEKLVINFATGAPLATGSIELNAGGAIITV